MTFESLSIECDNISHAWAAALIVACRRGAGALVPLVVAVNLPNGQAEEDLRIRCEADRFMARYPKVKPCHTTANTIFPEFLWNPDKPREALFNRYFTMLPRLRREPANRKGIYFERMTAYGETRQNQLDHVISTYLKGNHRASALQVCICDPPRDHTDQHQRGFPCLQMVNFIPDTERGELHVVGTYATQWLIDRAYGNYLGLCRLGTFVAHELGMRLTKMICIAPKGEIGTPNKGEVRDFVQRLRPLLPEEVVALCNGEAD